MLLLSACSSEQKKRMSVIWSGTLAGMLSAAKDCAVRGRNGLRQRSHLPGCLPNEKWLGIMRANCCAAIPAIPSQSLNFARRLSSAVPAREQQNKSH